MATYSSPLVAEHTLQPVKMRTPLRGFANLLRKEHGLWWGTRKWLVHLLVWPLIMNGMVVVAAFNFAKEPNFTALQIADTVTTLFFLVAGQAAALGAVVATQGALVGEKQRGTAAWILSKPVSRSAFVLAKLVAQVLNVLGLAVVLPSLIFWGQSIILWGSAPDPVTFVGSVLLLALHVLFYLALTLLLGTLVQSSGPVAGIALGSLFGGLMAQDRLAQLARVMPWVLPSAAGLHATQVAGVKWTLPAIATALWIGLFVAAALWRFRREEF